MLRKYLDMRYLFNKNLNSYIYYTSNGLLSVIHLNFESNSNIVIEKLRTYQFSHIQRTKH